MSKIHYDKGVFMKFRKPKSSNDSNNPNIFLTVLKGALIALSISLIGILIFAFVLRFVAIPDNAISPINQVIKGISVLVATLIALKKSKEMGLVTGLLIGLVYTAVSFLTFSILDGHFSFSTTLLNDLLFGSVIGAICGIIAVNLKRKSA